MVDIDTMRHPFGVLRNPRSPTCWRRTASLRSTQRRLRVGGASAAYIHAIQVRDKREKLNKRMPVREKKKHPCICIVYIILIQHIKLIYVYV